MRSWVYLGQESMGQCLSPCCDTSASPGGPGGQVNSQGQGYDAAAQGRTTRLYIHGSIPLSESKQDAGGGGEPHHQLAGTPGSDWKMFTPYPKLPPIKKQGVSGGVEAKRMSLISRGGDSGGGVSEAKIVLMYEQYRDSDEDCILAEGIERFCLDLEVKPEEFVVLVLALVALGWLLVLP